MKNQIIPTLLFMASATMAVAQSSADQPKADELEHGYTAGHYIDFSGNQHEGEIYYSEMKPDEILYRKTNTEKAVRVGVSNIKSFRTQAGFNAENIGGALYVPVNEEEKIKIYKRYVPASGSATGKGHYHHYVVIEDKLPLTAITDEATLYPIHVKAPTLLADCPSVCEKIKSKQTGYVVTKTHSGDLVWMQIAKDYEMCE